MDLYPKNKLSEYKVKRFIISFYIIGILGFVFPFSRDIFIIITPYALLLNTYLLAIYHNKYNIKTLLVFAFILLAGYTIEVIGVQTGLIFGNYKYENALGFKILETPPLIGVNWLLLIYLSTSVLSEIKIRNWIKILLAPLLMLIYDLALEIVAPKTNMWQWENSEVPIKNYIAWYIIALIFVIILNTFKINTRNPLSKIILICQFLFFSLLAILL